MKLSKLQPQIAWIPGWEGRYAITTAGRVYSYHRNPLKPRLRSQSGNGNGYMRVTLWDPERSVTITVHRLVMLTFVGPRPSGLHEVNHIDGDKKNNRLGNLEYVTSTENRAHAVKNGLVPWHKRKAEA